MICFFCLIYLDFFKLEGVEISKKDKFLRSNEAIRFSPIVVIDEDGTNLGTIPTPKALEIAYEKGLDLVEINPTNRPPICKVMDFGKYKYDLAKKEKEAKAKRQEVELKEIRLTFKIGDHDLEYKARQANDFISQGHKVKVSMRLRGRENALTETAMAVFKKFTEVAGLDYEQSPLRAGNQITAYLTKKKEVKTN